MFVLLLRVLLTVDGFWIGWLDLLHLVHLHNSGLHTTQRYRYSTQFAVRTSILSLH
jgi:hypothetical protein